MEKHFEKLVLIVTYLSIIIINYQNNKSFIFHVLGQFRQWLKGGIHSIWDTDSQIKQISSKVERKHHFLSNWPTPYMKKENKYNKIREGSLSTIIS